jgi:hypothetical protein
MRGVPSWTAQEANLCLWRPKKRVMPAKAGIHDFLAAAGSSAFVTLIEKSWMPAFAGMTGERTGGGRNPFSWNFNRIEYHCFFFKKAVLA